MMAIRTRAGRAGAASCLALAGLLAAGCGERIEYSPTREPGIYQGKTDEKPWASVPKVAGASKWQAGDRGSWESAIRQRQQAQNEYVRTR